MIMNDFTKSLEEGVKNFLDLLDGPYDTKETCLQCYLSSFLLMKKFEIKQEKCFLLDQNVASLDRKKLEIGQLLPNDEEKNIFKKKIRIDLMISNANTLLELKVVKYDELKQIHCYPYVYRNGNISDYCFDIKVIQNSINNNKSLARNPDIKPIFKYNGQQYLTFFHEGQIWYDLIKLLAIKQQKTDYNKYKIYLAGIIKNYKHNSDYSNNKSYFNEESEVRCKLKNLLYYLSDQNNEQVSILHYFKKKQEVLEIRKITVSISNLSFEIKVFPNQSNTWYGYYIDIKNNKQQKAEQIAPADRQPAALLGGS